MKSRKRCFDFKIFNGGSRKKKYFLTLRCLITKKDKTNIKFLTSFNNKRVKLKI